MNVGFNFMRLLVDAEGFETKVYNDSAGYPSIGIGHKLTQSELSSGKILINHQPVKYREGLTTDQVYSLARQDVSWAAECVSKAVNVPLNQNQFDALCLMVVNIGSGAFRGSTLLRELNFRRYDQVPIQMARWHIAGGVPHVLDSRRQKEIKLWNTDI